MLESVVRGKISLETKRHRQGTIRIATTRIRTLLSRPSGRFCIIADLLSRVSKLRRDVQFVHRLNDDAQVMAEHFAERFVDLRRE